MVMTVDVAMIVIAMYDPLFIIDSYVAIFGIVGMVVTVLEAVIILVIVVVLYVLVWLVFGNVGMIVVWDGCGNVVINNVAVIVVTMAYFFTTNWVK
jgi:hypothetical protein